MEKDSEITWACKEMQERVKAPKEAERAHNNMKKRQNRIKSHNKGSLPSTTSKEPKMANASKKM